jgi:tRNA threonylcarbamoyladenosine biosynthesis protein TsaB
VNFYAEIMHTLVMDTATEKACLALLHQKELLASLHLDGGPLLSRNLALEVDLFLKKHGGKPQKIAVGNGPGSFTGTRMGLSLAQALSWGWGIPLVLFCSLKLFAPCSHAPFAVLFDARSHGVYAWLPGHSTASLLSIPQAQASLPSTIASPHPHLLRHRFPSQFSWLETSPSPTLAETD